MGKVIAIVNQKGGVGKTTCTYNIAASLAKRGKRVLMIDWDYQASLTMSCGYRVVAPIDAPDIELTDRDGFTFGGRRFSFDEEQFDLSGEIFGRAILHGLYLDPSEWQGGPETAIGLPGACPFRVRHLAAE